jgi:uroporphyrin-3 C-methyltransferase
MNETSSSNDPATETHSPAITGDEPSQDQTPDHAVQKQGKGGGAWLILVFMLLVLAAVGAGGYFLWHTLQTTAQQLKAGEATTRQQLDTLQQRTTQLEQQVNNSSLGDDIKNLQTQQHALEDSLAELRGKLTGGARSWDVEEIAALLQIANDRLHLEKEVAPSLAALEAADRHLQALNNPALLDVRRLLAEEITALRATANPDIDGMALSLGALIQGIDRLPIASAALPKTASPASSSTAQGWRAVLHDLWIKLRSLVSIQHRGQAEHPLLAPDQRYFLRQNLQLTLEAARIALLRRDRQTYRQTLSSAQQWITQYFDTNAPATSGALQELTHLQATDIAPQLPDISASLTALRTWLKEQGSRKVDHGTGAAQS